MAIDKHIDLPEDSDDLFARLNKQLEDIELNEIIDGISGSDLAELGFTSDKQLTIKRAHHQRKLEKEQIVLEPDIEFVRFPEKTKFEDIQVESVLHLKTISQGTLVATRERTSEIKSALGYNIEITETEKKDSFTASINGKLVLIGSVPHLFPSDIDCNVALSVADDKMSVSMDCTPAYGDGIPLTITTVRNALNTLGVVHGIYILAIENAVASANKSLSTQTGIIVAEGTAPINGKSGQIDFRFEIGHQEYDFKILPDGRIDYRSTTNILMAEEGQLLAVKNDPASGMNGTDVFNNSVPAEDGKAATLLAGNGVTVSPDGKQFVAEFNGYILYNRPVLEVVNTYIIKGNVDFSTGNVNFNGIVIITGNVPDGFEVKASGDIIVMKNVEAARLEAGRDIIIKGGIQGKEKGFISAGRDIFAEYVQNGHLEAQGVIDIGNFVINSYIATTSQVILKNKRGILIGGEAYALRGFDVQSLGSEQGVKTYVEAGTDFLVIKKIKELNEIITMMAANLKKIDDTLRTVSVAFRKNPALATARKPLVIKALEKREEIDNNLKIMQSKCEQLREQSLTTEVCFVKVYEYCYSDVIIKINKAQTSIMKTRSNVRFYEDTEEGRVSCKYY